MIEIPRTPIDVAAILERVAERFDVTVDDLKGRDRHKQVTAARHVAMWAVRQRKLSFPEIGRLFGNRDHTTVMNAVRKIDRECRASAAFERELRELAWPGEERSVVRTRVEVEPGTGVWVA